MTDAGRVTGDYGLDSPRMTRTLGIAIATALLVTVVAGIVDAVTVMVAAFVTSLIVSMLGLVLVRSSRVHKVHERTRLVDRLGLEGHERVLDIGCGRGLLLLEVASRLDANGHAIGTDVWPAAHVVDGAERTTPAALRSNARAEGMEGFAITSGSALGLPFRDGAFDAVVSGLALHHVEGFASRVHAVRELARVLAVGGRVVLIDRRHTRTYVDALRAANFVEVARSRPVWRLLPPARYVTGTKAEVKERTLVSPADDIPEQVIEELVAAPATAPEPEPEDLDRPSEPEPEPTAPV